MKILMIAPQPFFEPRGTPISAYQRLHGLSSLNYEVDLVTYHIGNDVEMQGLTIHRIPNIPFIKSIDIGPSWAKVLLDILVFFKTIMMLLFNRYDVIHSHEEAAFFAAFLSKIFRTPHLYDMHSSLHQQFANSKFGHYGIVVKIFDVLERWVINSCDSMLTIGTDLEERAIAIKPTVKQTRLENLPVHVIEPIPAQHVVSELKCKLGLENKQIVVYTGTFEHYQGLDLLFDSAELAIKKNPDLHFVMVGGKPNQIDERKAQVQEKGLNDYFTFVGAVSPAQTLAYLEMAHMLVSPRTEGLSVPLKIYTYLCSGKPIVATKLLAHTQILNDSNSMLVEPEPEAFAEGILKLIHNPELGRSLGMEGQVIAKKKYSSENYFNRLKQVYQAL